MMCLVVMLLNQVWLSFVYSVSFRKIVQIRSLDEMIVLLFSS